MVEQEETPGAVERARLLRDHQLHRTVVLLGLAAVAHRQVGVGQQAEGRGIQRARNRLLAVLDRRRPAVPARLQPGQSSQNAIVLRRDGETVPQLTVGFVQMPVPEGEVAQPEIEPGELFSRDALNLGCLVSCCAEQRRACPAWPCSSCQRASRGATLSLFR